jgi:hypothetical protein
VFRLETREVDRLLLGLAGASNPPIRDQHRANGARPEASVSQAPAVRCKHVVRLAVRLVFS